MDEFFMISFLLPVLILIVYTFFSWNKRSFNIYSPFFLPYVSFLLSYGIPYLICLYSKDEFYINYYPKAILLQNIGIPSFFLGNLIVQIFKKRKINIINIKDVKIEQSPNIMKMFLFFGIFLLLIYGIVTGNSITLLKGGDIEDLRRSAEIGKGILKESAIFFSTFTTLWFLSINIIKKRILFLNILLILFTSIFLFFNVGHKAPAIWLFIFALAIFNKHKIINPIKVFILGSILLVIIELLNTIRTGEFNLKNIPQRILLNPTIVYIVNYNQILKNVDNNNIELQYGKEYLQNSLYIIPRFIFPNKPISFDYYIKEKLGYELPGGGTPAGIMGSLYINFSFFGTIVGMFILGFLYSKIFEIYKWEKNISNVIILVMLLPAILSPSTLISTLEILFLFYFIVLFVNKFLVFFITTKRRDYFTEQVPNIKIKRVLNPKNATERK